MLQEVNGKAQKIHGRAMQVDGSCWPAQQNVRRYETKFGMMQLDTWLGIPTED